MRVAYLSNHYPLTTHTFIRREIHAVEEAGVEVVRTSVRRSSESLPDAADREEAARTFVVLERGAAGLLADVAWTALRRPLPFLRTAWRAVRLGFGSHRGWLWHLGYLAEACSLLRRFERTPVDHVHAHFGTNAAMVAMLLRGLGGPPYSVAVHGPGEFDNPAEIHLPEKVADAAFVTAITSFARSQIFRWTHPDHWHKVHVIRCGVEEKFLEGAVVPVPEARRLVCVGRLGRSKGHGILVEAAGRLRDEGLDFEVLLIGDGELRPRIEAMIAERGLGDVIRIGGWMDGDGVRRELLDSRGLVLPSFGEGLPVVIMEALALARPAIATRIAGIAELVEDGTNGWLVNASSVDELTAAMREMLTAPPERLLEMGQAGRRAAAEKHDARREGEKLAKLLLASAAD
ncbi:MAG: glycosyltransferase [Myxococcales bacterium]|nr:glycosyltransferase [Myxococcales bacterium]